MAVWSRSVVIDDVSVRELCSVWYECLISSAEWYGWAWHGNVCIVGVMSKHRLTRTWRMLTGKSASSSYVVSRREIVREVLTLDSRACQW